MFIVANRVPVASGWRETFEERFRQRAGQIDKQPGFVRMQILKPESDDTPYVVLTSWQDKVSFDAWVHSEDFKLAHRNPMPKEAFDGEGKLEMHEVIICAESSRNSSYGVGQFASYCININCIPDNKPIKGPKALFDIRIN